MPADLDLDALDALLKGVAPRGLSVDGTKLLDARAYGPLLIAESPGNEGGRPAEYLHLIAAAVNALPALLRRARIGDAAREVLECDERLQRASAARGEAAMKKPFDTAEYDRCAAEFMSANRALEAAIDAWDAARARYRALLETKDAR